MLIINLHNVVVEPFNIYDRNAAPRIDIHQFSLAIDWLSKNFELISLDELLWQLNKKSVNNRAATLTFDDGYCGVLRHAFPILQERGVNASVMVVTQALESASKLFHFEELEMAFRMTKASKLNLPGRPAQPVETVADRMRCLKALKQELKLQPEAERRQNHDLLLQNLGVTREQITEESKKFPVFEKLNGDQLKFLARSGWTIGSHTRTHRTLSCLNDKEAMQEISDSRDEIQAHLGLTAMPFAYPYGGPQHIGSRVYDLVAKSGYSCALTTIRGKNTPDSNIFRLRRIDIEDLLRNQPEIFDGVEKTRKTSTRGKPDIYEQSSIHYQ
ncbi:MAG: polysaccharide deacetylase family protein [Oscillatoria sp. PMC 1051.18]|nr:polysaccharide deacetylase family protein [Oscillatoria sp. PMC 1051.18]